MASQAGQLYVGLNQRILIQSAEDAFRQIERRPIKLRFDTGGLGPGGLGAISRDAKDFEKSLKSAEARVLAFGATTGQIYAMVRGIKELTRVTIQVEKNLADINVILGASTKNLKQFSDSLFNIAKNTGQSFDVVSKSAAEFARQGLGMEETLKRTRDALILTRLSGLDVVDSTEAITAAINSFNETILDSTTLINKFAKVDAAFAVSSADLAEALKRVGSTAQDTGVSLDSLIGLVTSAQQTTARGGAVIGNGLKSIFQRIQRPEVLQQLIDFGIQITDLQGQILPADKLLINLAKTYDKLSVSQKNQTVQLSAGIFQANVFRAILGDLAKGELSVYNNALKASATATDEAIKRNKELGKTLSSELNSFFAALTQIGSNIGGQTVNPIIKNLLSSFNDITAFEDVGNSIGKTIFSGIANFFSSSGLILFSVITGKLLKNLISFAATASQVLLSNNGIQKETEQIITRILGTNNSIVQASSKRLAVEQNVLQTIRAQNSALSQAQFIIEGSKTKMRGRNFLSSPQVGPPGLFNNQQSQVGITGLGTASTSIFAGNRNLNTSYERTLYQGFLNVPVYDRTTNRYRDPETGRIVNKERAQFLGAAGPGFVPAIGAALNPLRAAAQLSQSQANNQPDTTVSASRQRDQALKVAELSRITAANKARFDAERNAEESQKRARQLSLDRQQRFGSALLGASIAVPFLQGSIEQSFSGDTLSGRRGKGITGALGSGLSAGLAAGFASTLIPPAAPFAPIIAGISALVISISSLVPVIENWNSTLPDLQKNIETLRDTNNAVQASGQEMIRIYEQLDNNTISKTDRFKLQNRLVQLKSTQPSLAGAQTPDEIRDLIGKSGTRTSNLINSDELSTFFQEGRIKGSLFSRIPLEPPKFTGINSPFFPKIGDLQPRNKILANTSTIDAFANYINKYTDKDGRNISGYLDGDSEESSVAKAIFQSGDPGLFSRNLPSIFKDAGLSGGENIVSEFLKNSGPEQKALLTGLGANRFSNNYLKGLGLGLGSGSVVGQEQGPGVSGFLGKFNKEVIDSSTAIAQFIDNLKRASDALAESRESELRVIETLESGREDLYSRRLDPLAIAQSQSGRNLGRINLGTSNARNANLANLQASTAGLGLGVLSGLKNNTVAGINLDGIPDFRTQFQALRSESEINGFSQDNAQRALDLSEKLLNSDILTLDENKKLRDSIEKQRNDIRTYSDIDKNISSDNANKIKENTAALTILSARIERYTTPGAKRAFAAGETNRDEYVAELLSDSRSLNRREGVSNKAKFGQVGDLLQGSLSYNSTSFFDEIQEGAVDAATTFRTEFSQAFKDFASGAKNAKDAFSDFALSVASTVQSKLIDIGINSLLGSVFNQKSSVGSLFSSNGRRFAEGGKVIGGSGAKDDVIAALTGGEYVVQKSVVDKLGTDFFDTLNNSAKISLTNRYDYNDPTRPTAGSANVSPFLSAYALEDSNNPQNAIRNSREEGLLSYLLDYNSYNSNKSAAMNAFKKQKQQQLIGTYISAGLAGASPFLALGGGSRPPPGTTTGAYGYSSFAPIGRASGGTVPAALTGGEYVMSRGSTSRIGSSTLNSINSGFSKFASGGLVGGDGTSDLLARLVESNNSLNKIISNMVSPQGGGAPSINISNTFNVEGGKAQKSESKSDSSEPDVEKSKALGEAINATIYKTLVNELRPGGILYGARS